MRFPIKRNLLILAIVPGLLSLLSLFFVWVRGPFFYSFSSDPAYVYLVSSLSAATLRFDLIGHTDHPGTPLQLFGGLIIRLLHPFDSNSDLINKVFQTPELYITTIVLVLIALTFMAFFYSGLLIFRRTGSLWLAILVQAAPFFSGMTVYESLSRFRPETPILIILQLVNTLLVVNIFAKSPQSKDKMLYLKFSLLVGLGLALKYTFLPLIILPLVVLNDRKEKIKYLIVTFLVFAILVVPVMSNFHRSLEFVAVNILSTQAYGSGSFGIWEMDNALGGIPKLLITEPILSFLTLLFPVFLIYLILSKKMSKSIFKDIHYKLAIACLVIIFLQSSVFFKNHSIRYILPVAFLTIPFGLAFSSLANKYFFNGALQRNIFKLNRAKAILIIALAIYPSVNLYNYFDIFKKYEVNRSNAYETIKELQGLKMFGYICSVPEAGLYMGNSYAGYYYSNYQQKIYGDMYAFNGWKEPYTIDYWGRNMSLDDIVGEYGTLNYCGLGGFYKLFEKYAADNGYSIKRITEPSMKYTSDEVVVKYELRKL